MLTTPLLKIPLLFSAAVCTYRGMTPPTRPPPPSEQKRFTKGDFMTRTTSIQLKLTAASKIALCSAALVEAAVLLAQQCPSRHVSGEVFSQLLPSALRSSPLRLTYASVSGCILSSAGGLIRVWCHRELGRFFTWQMAVRDDHKLIVTGPYAFVQHPSYIGWALLAAGNIILVLSKGSYVMESGIWESTYGKAVTCAVIAYVSWVGCSLLTRMKKECDVLHATFGSEWEAYAKRTPYWLIPFVY